MLCSSKEKTNSLVNIQKTFTKNKYDTLQQPSIELHAPDLRPNLNWYIVGPKYQFTPVASKTDTSDMIHCLRLSKF